MTTEDMILLAPITIFGIIVISWIFKVQVIPEIKEAWKRYLRKRYGGYIK